ncbi:MAG: PilN domain-containing protein [Planctomycetota bacterium]
MCSVSAAAAENEEPVRVESFVLQREHAGRTSTRANTRGSAQTKRIVTLEGTAADSQAVASFAASLRDSGAFSDVELKSTKVDTTGPKERVHYVLDCMF